MAKKSVAKKPTGRNVPATRQQSRDVATGSSSAPKRMMKKMEASSGKGLSTAAEEDRKSVV